MPHTYEFPRAALAVDCVVFGLDDDALKLLLIERGLEPFKGRWALPGGFVRLDESLEEAARRELSEETGVSELFLEQLRAFGTVDRDPRERVVSVAFYALAKLSDHRIRAATDAAGVDWFPADNPPETAFDHAEIIRTARETLTRKLRTQPIGFELLPEVFPLRDLQRLYEQVLGRELDKRNFRKKILSMGILDETGEIETNVSHRAARLYRFDPQRYRQRVDGGFHFEI